MKKLIAVISVGCLLMFAAVFFHYMHERQALRERWARIGQNDAHELISAGYLEIGIGRGKVWRPTFERLLTERYGLKFPRPDSGDRCGGDHERAGVISDAYLKTMDGEISRRFVNGELEQLAIEAEDICRAEQAAASNPYQPPSSDDSK